jgi:hypothetical protein
MRQLPPVTGTANRQIDDRENWVRGALLVTVLGVPALVALMATPEIVFGMVVGVAGLKLVKWGLGCIETSDDADQSKKPCDERSTWKTTAD